MNSLEKIKRLIKKLHVTPPVQMHERTLKDILDAQEKSKKTESAFLPNIRRLTMKNRITKLAAAAVVVIGILLGLEFLGGPSAATVAWADVTEHIAQVDYVHAYYFKSRDNVLKSDFEAWYDDGMMVIRGKMGDMVYDDGQIQQGFTREGRRTTKEPSKFADGQTFFEVYTGGLLSDKNEQFNQQIPANVGDDFLIYELDWTGDDSEYIESVFITVGRNSLLPVQMKIYHNDGDYDMIIFDYQAPAKPEGFFEAPQVGSYNVRAKVLLDSEEVILDIEGAPGLKQAIVRLHDMYNGPAEQLPPDYRRKVFPRTYKKKGGPIFRLDVAFVTDEGYKSSTNDLIVMWLNEAKQCGVGSEAGRLDNWPDGKYRNIRFSPMLKPTDRNDTYIVEMSCWIKTTED